MSFISETGMVWDDKYASNYKIKDKDDPLFNEDKNPFNTSFNTVEPPCTFCPVRTTCPEECSQFKLYASKGKWVDHPFSK